MRELPILFSAPMVRAILDGRKTVTRRVVKPQPTLETTSWQRDHGGSGKWMAQGPAPATGGTRQTMPWSPCPYGQPGDRLWVRETFALEHAVEHDQEPPFADGRPVRRRDEPGEARWVQPHYRATDPTPELSYEFGCSNKCPENEPHVHWKPSIHMPRWASRITLEVTGVRVERLQDITEDQARAEGADENVLPLIKVQASSPMAARPAVYRDHRDIFSALWESINGAGSWDANPWVWLVEFNRIEQERKAA